MRVDAHRWVELSATLRQRLLAVADPIRPTSRAAIARLNSANIRYDIGDLSGALADYDDALRAFGTQAYTVELDGGELNDDPLAPISPSARAIVAEPVEIIRDRWGINHIYAQNEHDLFFAQGFVQAQDRFFEMDVRRQPTLRLDRTDEAFSESLTTTLK